MSNILIQLVKTPNKLYCYDVNTNQVFNVSESEYTIINSIVNGEIEWDERLDYYAEQGLLKPIEIKKLQHPETQRIEYYLESHINQITLQLTQNCNLRCSYCAYTNSNNTSQRNHSLKKMDLKTAKNSIDFFVKHSCDSRSVAIGLYGGEPLIEFELLKQIIEYAESQFIGKKVTFSMTTNGTLLTPEKFMYLIQHNVSVVVSIDGPKRIHDTNRVMVNGQGSFGSILTNLRDIYSEYGEKIYEKLSLNMVINPMDDLDEICSLFEDELFRNIQLRYSIVDDIYNDKETTFSNDFIKKYRYQYFIMLLKNKNIISRIEVPKLFAAEEVRL